jgi:hypothetical protein
MLAECALGREAIDRLKPIEWNLVGESVFAVRWRDIAKHHSKWLGQFTADSLPFDQHSLIQVGSGLVGSDEENVSSGDRAARAVYLLAVGIGVALLDQGWHAHTRPGMPVRFVRGSETVEPFGAVHALTEGAIAPDAWKVQCHTLGIAGRLLGDPEALDGALSRGAASPRHCQK